MCGSIVLGALGLFLAARLATCGVRRRWAYGHGYGGGCHGRGGWHGGWHGHHGWHGHPGWRGGPHGGPGGGCGPECGGPGPWDRGDDGAEGGERAGEARGGPHGHGPRGRWRGGPGFGRGFGRRWALRWISEQLDATPGQEKVIASALEVMEKALREAKDTLGKSRGTLADALRGEEFGHEKVGEAWVSHDNAFEKVRLELVTELQKVHEALDEKQRKILADLVESGGVWR